MTISKHPESQHAAVSPLCLRKKLRLLISAAGILKGLEEVCKEWWIIKSNFAVTEENVPVWKHFESGIAALIWDTAPREPEEELEINLELISEFIHTVQ